MSFVEPAEPGKPVRPATRSKNAAELGAELARLCEVELAMLPNLEVEPEDVRAALLTGIARCGDCAFRAGTLPNQNAATVMNALKCVVEGETFYCHKGVPEGEEASRPCGGYVILRVAHVRNEAES